MMKSILYIFTFLCFSFLCFGYSTADTVIDKIKDSTIACDYLIVCPETMGRPAVQLAEHRNFFKGDNVEFAKVAYLERILIEFNGSDFKKRYQTLKEALQWASENWSTPLKYLVLIGDDTYEIDTDSTAYSTGRMPTYYPINNRVYNLGTISMLGTSDDAYCIMPNSPWLFCGRIPAQSAALCSIYVDKVKKYDLFKGDKSWRNRIITISDDNYQGGQVDIICEINPFQAFCENLASINRGVFISKQYLSAFPTDPFNRKPEAKQSIISAINKGAGIIFFQGHGSNTLLTDEQVLITSDFDRLQNDSTPSAFFSFTSGNGDFFSNSGETMCKRFLFKESGGCITYFSSPTLNYAGSNEQLARKIFDIINNTPHKSIGQLIYEAKEAKSNPGMFTYYYLLGDPAIQLFSKKTVPVVVHAVQDTGSLQSATVSLVDTSSIHPQYNCYFEITSCDTVNALYPEDSRYVKETILFSKHVAAFGPNFSIDFPKSVEAHLKITVYVWNDSADGHTMLDLDIPSAVSLVPEKQSQKNMIHEINLFNTTLTIPKAIRYQQTGRLKIYDLRGKLVYNATIGSGQTRFDIGSKVTASGRYMLLVNIGELQFQKSFMIVK